MNEKISKLEYEISAGMQTLAHSENRNISTKAVVYHESETVGLNPTNN